MSSETQTQANTALTYEAVCARHGVVAARGTREIAERGNAAHRETCGHTTQILEVCPNCEQWRRYGDCFNDCAARGFAPKGGGA